MTGPIKRTRRWWRRRADGLRSAADAPGRLKLLWLSEAVVALWLAAVAWRWAPTVAGRLVDLEAWPPWPALAAAPLLGAAVALGAPGQLVRALQAAQRRLVDRAERRGHVEVTDDDLLDDEDVQDQRDEQSESA